LGLLATFDVNPFMKPRNFQNKVFKIHENDKKRARKHFQDFPSSWTQTTNNPEEE
jgi:hypothetical protein